MKGLKQKLFDEIKLNGYCEYDYLEDITRELGYKSDNFTRRMRELTTGENRSIRPILTEKKFIKGYMFIGKHEGVQIQKFPQIALKL